MRSAAERRPYLRPLLFPPRSAGTAFHRRPQRGGGRSTRRRRRRHPYHLYFQPNDYSDAGDSVPYYTTLSLWDTFRACHPWYSIVTPEVTDGAVDSFMRHYRTFGRLPVMSYGGMNFDCMIGNHSVPVIVDAFLKSGAPKVSPPAAGGRVGADLRAARVDWEAVYQQIKETLTKPHPGKPKENWDAYDRYGYFPYDVINGEGVSRTMECCYDDWCAAQMAKALGKSSTGTWREPFDPYAFGHGAGRDNDFTEGNAFQYSWHVMHDIAGLVAAMGGHDAAWAVDDAIRESLTSGSCHQAVKPNLEGRRWIHRTNWIIICVVKACCSFLNMCS